MHVELDDFNTGWYGVAISLRNEEIDILIERLNRLKQDSTQHFHLSSDYEGDGGVGDIEFSVQIDETDNMSIV